MSSERPGNLVIVRGEGQKVLIGADIVIEVVWARTGQAQLSIRAPKSVPILRDDAKVTTKKEAQP